MRQIVLDTETTGLSVADGHRIIEIGAVELIDRKITGKDFHCYLNPERSVDRGSFEVHGLSDNFLLEQPLFADIVDDLLQFVEGAEVLIHNADFDVPFINAELQLLSNTDYFDSYVGKITDTLKLSRQLKPTGRHNLDALCKYFEIDTTARDKHGALIDSILLAKVYLALTSQQFVFNFENQCGNTDDIQAIDSTLCQKIPVIKATNDELAAHKRVLDLFDKNK